MAADELVQFRLVREHELDGAPGQEPELVECGELERVAGRDGESAVASFDGHAVLLVDELRGEGFEHVALDGGRREIDNGHVELIAQRVEHVVGAHEPEPDEDPVETFTTPPLLGDRRVELVARDQAPFFENDTDAHWLVPCPQ